jgi:hypothetical protein
MLDHLEEYREKSKIFTKECEKFWYESFYNQLNLFLSTKIK